jgi:hypothetical protein
MRLIITILIILPLFCKAQNFYLSATGNDGNNGLTTATPKATMKAIDTLINASMSPNIVAAIEGGSDFRQESQLLLRGDVSFTTYNRNLSGKSALPKFIGTTIHNSGWTLTGTNTYQKSISHTISLTSGTLLNGYSWMYVIEIDTLLERTAPLTARKYLTWRWTPESVDTTVGSYSAVAYNPSQTPVLVSIHTSNGQSPNNNSQYRYEVVTSEGAVYRRLSGNTYGQQRLTVKGMFALDYGSGVGAIASAVDSMTIDSSVIMGTAIHGGVYGNYSTVKNSAFIGGEPNINSITVVFYKSLGANETNSILNTTFLGNKYGVYTHTTGGAPVKHGKLSIKNTYFYDSEMEAIAGGDTDTCEIENVYADSVKYFARPRTAISYINNTIVRNAEVFTNSSGNNMFINNCFFKSSPYFHTRPFGNGYANRMKITNSTVHVKNPFTASGMVLFDVLDTTSRYNVKNNIFIIELKPGVFSQMAKANTWAGAGTGPDSFDYNVYIIVSGNPFWTVTNSATVGDITGVHPLTLWQNQSGQDQHSIFMDLRNTGVPLTDIFVDPDNGNYTLTNSVRADSIRAISAGMTTPVLRWPTTPTREQVLATVTDGTFQNVSTLMQPGYVPPVVIPPYVPPVIIPANNIKGSKRIGANLKFH